IRVYEAQYLREIAAANLIEVAAAGGPWPLWRAIPCHVVSLALPRGYCTVVRWVGGVGTWSCGNLTAAEPGRAGTRSRGVVRVGPALASVSGVRRNRPGNERFGIGGGTPP